MINSSAIQYLFAKQWPSEVRNTLHLISKVPVTLTYTQRILQCHHHIPVAIAFKFSQLVVGFVSINPRTSSAGIFAMLNSANWLCST